MHGRTHPLVRQGMHALCSSSCPPCTACCNQHRARVAECCDEALPLPQSSGRARRCFASGVSRMSVQCVCARRLALAGHAPRPHQLKTAINVCIRDRHACFCTEVPGGIPRLWGARKRFPARRDGTSEIFKKESRSELAHSYKLTREHKRCSFAPTTHLH